MVSTLVPVCHRTEPCWFTSRTVQRFAAEQKGAGARAGDSLSFMSVNHGTRDDVMVDIRPSSSFIIELYLLLSSRTVDS